MVLNLVKIKEGVNLRPYSVDSATFGMKQTMAVATKRKTEVSALFS
jgi:hypothetical protein